MIFRLNSKNVKNSFQEELRFIRQQAPYQPEWSKCEQFYGLIKKVLDLLIKAHPVAAKQLFSLEKSIASWYQHVKQEFFKKNKQLVDHSEAIKLKISEDVVMVLEEAGYYLRGIIQEYHDKNIEIIYVRYLKALKKLVWNKCTIQQDKISVQTQTDFQQSDYYRSLSSTIKCVKGDTEMTIEETPKKKSDHDIATLKFIRAKEENLDLQRKVNRYQHMLQDLSEKNSKLASEVAKLIDQNIKIKENQTKCIVQVNKLTELLNRIQSEEAVKSKQQQEMLQNFSFSQRKCQKLSYLKDSLHESLHIAEQQIMKKMQSLKIDNQNDQFIQNDLEYATVKKIGSSKQIQHQFQSFTRMILVQALAIEDSIIHEFK